MHSFVIHALIQHSMHQPTDDMTWHTMDAAVGRDGGLRHQAEWVEVEDREA